MESVGSARVNSDNRTAEAPTFSTPRLQEDSLPQNNTQVQVSPAVRKLYNRLKLSVGIVRTLFIPIVSVGIVATGVSTLLEQVIRGYLINDYLVFLVFSLILGAAQGLLGLPLSFYSGFSLEHRFGLSNQTLPRWAWEGVKGILVGIPLMTPILLAFFYCLRTFGADWWLPVGMVLFCFSIVLARIAPVMIFPLFYKFTPVLESNLKERILSLCEKAGMQVSGVFLFNLSKNTRKANAAFAGIGRSKRVILGDTLVGNFSEDEVETVLAHELGHYVLNHIWIGMAAGAVSTFAGLYLTARVYDSLLPVFGYTEIASVAALPLLGVLLGIYSFATSPLGNMLSRSHERAADQYAIRLTGKKEAFISALKRLAKTNLADESPNSLVEFLFYSHPSIQKRVQAVERM